MTTAAATETSVETVVDAVVSEELALKQMEAGFSGTSLPNEEGTPPKEDADGTATDETVDTGEGETVATGTTDAPPTDANAEAPREVNPEELRKALDLLQTIPDLQSKLDKLRGDAFGKIGGLERLLKTLQETTPLGQEIKVEEEDLKELTVDFPETTKALAPALTRVLNKFKGTGVKPVVDEETIVKRAAEIADQISSRRVAVALLTQAHEDWPELVGAEGSQTEFRTWVKSQGEEVEKEVFSTWDHRKLSKKLTEFKETKAKAQAKPKPPSTTSSTKTDVRSQRLAEAVQPRGGKLPPAPKAKTPEEEFEEGFNQGPGGSMK